MIELSGSTPSMTGDNSFIDKSNILSKLDSKSFIELELGCGNRKRKSTAIGIDQLDYGCVDIVGDVLTVLSQFPDQCVDVVRSFHFFEHVADVTDLLRGIERVMKEGGNLEIVVPHFSNPYYFSDLTHRSFFGLYTFDYLAANSNFSRKVPTYGKRIAFEVDGVELTFKSPRPFYGRYGIKRLIGGLFNSCNYMRELYEENFCYLFPCYEIRYRLRRISAL